MGFKINIIDRYKVVDKDGNLLEAFRILSNARKFLADYKKNHFCKDSSLEIIDTQEKVY